MKNELFDVPAAALPKDAPTCIDRRPVSVTSQVRAAGPTEQPERSRSLAVRGSAARCSNGGLPFDLIREGSNLLELTLRQSRCLTPLSISSRATQTLFSRF